eukprot:1914450-Amphidinium_carterae.1
MENGKREAVERRCRMELFAIYSGTSFSKCQTLLREFRTKYLPFVCRQVGGIIASKFQLSLSQERARMALNPLERV